jgi:hypothetical protein
MLKLTSLVTILFSVNAFASTNGGGVLMRNFSARPSYDLLGGTGGGGVIKSPEIVFHMGQKDGLVKFAYGHLESNQWQVQRVQISELDLIRNSDVVEALKQSQKDSNWAQIK